MIRVAVSGVGGRMGRLVAGAIEAADDLVLSAGFDPECAGEVVAGVPVAAEPEAVAGADVVVEFTQPDVVMENLKAWRSLGIHAVVGTSGFDETRIAAVRELWGEGPPNCLIAPNFSIGAVVMMRLSEIAAPHFAAAEIIELHHEAKVDAPSGTSIATAERIAAAGGATGGSGDPVETAGGARGVNVAGVPVHSVRLPGLVAHQQVRFGALGETVTISHDTSDRQSFMPGVLLAVRAVGDLAEPVTIGLEGLLGI